ncbi:MAG: iron-sulfur cluster assembly accessory protein [Lunatimonas sp.]|uniref:HesB/IscA family protein n=1 Tax=Lunatimonas sp. TaxID=2060141 RepID=UPI00263B83FF|nr:iron-sulfur cluster assembly accessory protein [Lunatimonas sp.]MCC5935695.1 iron-sulfur cluster assembly accessory protein [Lunatimonas sp.]
MLNPISISAKALDEIKNIMLHKNIPGEYTLRVGVKGGGCGGVSYMLGFDKPKTDDQVFEWEGLEILIEKKHVMFLMGMHIDFFESSEARGFTFINPEVPKRHDA